MSATACARRGDGLSATQIGEFHERGFLLARGLLPAARTARMVSELEYEVERAAGQLALWQLLEPRQLHHELPFAERLAALAAELPAPAVDWLWRRLHGKHHKTAGMFALRTAPELLDAVEALIGGEILAHPQTVLRVKLPQHEATVVPWHQDKAYLAEDSGDTLIVNLWIPLVPATRENGCLEIIAGSHQAELTHGLRSEQYAHAIDDGELPAGERVVCAADVGDVVVTAETVVHRSLPNATGTVRWSVDTRYCALGLPTGRSAVPGFVARSRSQPGRVLRNHRQWRALFADSGLDAAEGSGDPPPMASAELLADERALPRNARWQFRAPRAELAPGHSRQGAGGPGAGGNGGAHANGGPALRTPERLSSGPLTSGPLTPGSLTPGSLTPGSLTIEGNGSRHAIGCWHVPVRLDPGCWYRARVQATIAGIEHPGLSLFAQVAGHFLTPLPAAGDRLQLQCTFQYQGGGAVGRTAVSGAAPAGGDAGLEPFELYLRATAAGRVEWSRPSLVRVPPPPARTARIATVRFGAPTQTLSMGEQRARIAERLSQAGALGADLVTLGEFAPIQGVAPAAYGSYAEAAEQVPDGPVSKVLAAAAARHNMYVAAGILERRGPLVLNTAVIFDRSGELFGQYDKTHLTFGELREGVSCGETYPVFDLDFGRVAVHICYDEWFPEVARYYAHRGVELLLLPSAGGKPITWRTRALDNRIYLVSAATMPPSMIIDSSGAILAETHGDGLAYADLDLGQRQTNWYRDPTLAGGMPYIAPQMRMTVDDSLLDALHGVMTDASRTTTPAEEPE